MTSSAGVMSRLSDPIREVGVIGAGPVGLVTAAVLASWGFRTVLVERDAGRRESIADGRAPFYEPGLEQLIEAVGTALVVSDSVEALSSAEVVILCVGTPPQENGVPDLSDLRSAVGEVLPALMPNAVLAIKSTCPPGTSDAVQLSVRNYREDVQVVYCPEFLREGSAIADMLNPDRVVVGGADEQACATVSSLFYKPEIRLIVTNAVSAELIKYASNAFLATKISFANELANLCDLVGADVMEVTAGIGADTRIGTSFLRPGLGFGGSCFPKDVMGLHVTGALGGYTPKLLKACIEINIEQRQRFIERVRRAVGGCLRDQRIAVLGLAFKPGTDDLRQAPAVDVIQGLLLQGAIVKATDPVAVAKASAIFDAKILTPSLAECVRDADAVILATEWPEYVEADWQCIRDLMFGNVVVDGRNALDRDALEALGFRCFSVGRPSTEPVPID